MSHQHVPHHDMRVPRPALYAAGAMMLFAILAAWAGRNGVIERVSVPEGEIVMTRVLQFSAGDDSSLNVIDGTQGDMLGVVPSDEAGFINGVLRGLNHDRRIQKVPLDSAYHLIQTKANRLALLDPSTGRRVELLGFGDTNDEAFRRLMTLGRETE